jgi:hypothetical protein
LIEASASAVIALARALQVGTDELLGMRAPKIERLDHFLS